MPWKCAWFRGGLCQIQWHGTAARDLKRDRLPAAQREAPTIATRKDMLSASGLTSQRRKEQSRCQRGQHYTMPDQDLDIVSSPEARLSMCSCHYCFSYSSKW